VAAWRNILQFDRVKKWPHIAADISTYQVVMQVQMTDRNAKVPEEAFTEQFVTVQEQILQTIQRRLHTND
jgi:hypothetical protein